MKSQTGNDENLCDITDQKLFQYQYDNEELKYLIDYLQDSILPDDTKLAKKKTVGEAPYFEIYENKLYHIFYPHKKTK